MCTLFLLIIAVVSASAGTHADERRSSDGPIVTISDGKVLGYYDSTPYGNEFVAFEGIPFAAPPIGELRFQAPRRAERWTGVLKAHQTHTCVQNLPQYPGRDGVTIGDEDCLYINVYTPRLNNSTPLDVIVHIHGGGFLYSEPRQYGPAILMETGRVVFVNFNYRLGALGFLSTEDETVPGNNGLKDQVMAFEWIKDNVERFGGDPRSVTISGISAGSACVHLHYLSPLSKGLFHRGIAASGTALSPWAISENSAEKTRRLADMLRCDGADASAAVVDCLRTRAAADVVRAASSLTITPFVSVFGPVVERVDDGTAFLSAPPYELMHAGKIHDLPIIMSITQAEGLVPGAFFLSDDEYLRHVVDDRWYELAPTVLEYEHTVPPEDRDAVSLRIKRFYFKEKKISPDTFAEFVKMLGDRLFVADIELTAKLQARRNTAPVYFYYLGYRGVYSKSIVMSGKEDDFGVSHSDDGIYILWHEWATPEHSDDDKKMKRIFQDMWTSFARNSVPTLDGIVWNPLSRALDPIHYLHIAAPTKISMQARESFVDRRFWDSLPFDENRLPAATADQKEEL